MKRQVVPTRMELLKTKRALSLARKGYSLLKKKRDALIMELWKLVDEIKDLRKELNKEVKNARKALLNVLFIHSRYELEHVALLNRLEYELNIEEKNIMGVKLPDIEFKLVEKEVYKPPSPSVYAVVKTYRKLINQIVELANIESKIIKLLKEIEKTKRRVNALEYVVIPELEERIKFIKSKLEEMERESFVAMKFIKGKLEKSSSEEEVL